MTDQTDNAAAIEHDGTEPEGVIARAQDGGVALVPRAVPVGERVHNILSCGSGRE